MATEKRLIKRITERLKDAYPQADRNNLCPAIYYDDFAEIVDDVLSEVGEAVEVVRCKDCQKWQRHTMVDRERGHCRLYNVTKHESGYCDRGERKDSE